MPQTHHPCEFCDTDSDCQPKRVTIARQRKGQWFIFEDVPACVCPNCGHRYFDAQVAALMDAQMRATPADARPITAWAIPFDPSVG